MKQPSVQQPAAAAAHAPETSLTTRKAKNEYSPKQAVTAGEAGMADRRRSKKMRTLVVVNGRIQAGTGGTSYWQGFAGLLNLNPPRVVVVTLPRGEPTRLAFRRIGAALKASMSKADERQGR